MYTTTDGEERYTKEKSGRDGVDILCQILITLSYYKFRSLKDFMHAVETWPRDEKRVPSGENETILKAFASLPC